MGAGRTPPGGYPPPVGTVPMLSRVPAGELMDSPRRAPVRRTAEVLYSDTSWRPCQIVAWARHQGGWAARIRGYPDGRVRRLTLVPALGRVLAVLGQQRRPGQREHRTGHHHRAQRREQQREQPAPDVL